MNALFPEIEEAAPPCTARVVRILLGDVFAALAKLPDDSVDCVVTSPPYWGLRDYGTAKWVGGDPACPHKPNDTPEKRGFATSTLGGGKKTVGHSQEGYRHECPRCGAKRVDEQIGLERSLGEHIDVMVRVFREVRRVLKPTGTLWLNYGDCYATAPNGRSAADTKAAGNDDRTFRDKPFSTVGPINPPSGRRITAGQDRDDVDVGGWGSRDDSVRWRGGGSLKPKDLCMIPNRLAIALQEDGWWVRSEIIWHKPNPMPESIKDRPGSSHEKVFLLSKSERYYYDHIAVRQPLASASVARLALNVDAQVGSDRAHAGGKTNGRMKAVKFGGNKGQGDYGSAARRASGNEWDPTLEGANLRNVWTIPTAAFSDAHFATFPPELVERCLKAGCPVGGLVLDPFGGSGTTALVADGLGMDCTLIELNPAYVEIARKRLSDMFRTIDVESV